MQRRIGTQLILGAGLVSALVIGLMTALEMRSHAAQLLTERTRSANQLSETIKSSTHFDMLENRREDLHRQIRTIGELQNQGIHKVRLFNKEGRIMFSSDRAEIGTGLDKQAEACYACHAEGRPLEKLDIQARARIFKAPDGSRVLGIINPIPNEASCYTAECHAHSPQQSVLGVLDVNVSMREVDREVARSRGIMLGLASLAIFCTSLILWWLNRILVVRPVAALLEGTRRVSEGDFVSRIPVTAKHELGELAKAFNAMTQCIAETQRQLTLADKLASVGRLAAGVAHEINNPLTGVLSYASLLEKRHAQDPETLADLTVIVRETKRCRGIIRELLDFARPTPPVRRATDLNEVVNHAVAVITNELGLRHVNLKLDLAENLPLAHADGNQIQQVIVNLLLNAIDAVALEGGAITIITRMAYFSPSSRRPHSALHHQVSSFHPVVELAVEDNGRGIPPTDLPHLFEPFFTTKGPQGTGLGLAVTWSIIEAHGGTIDVFSELNKGTRFAVNLPLANAPTPIDPPPAPEALP